jgi:hypothetical protein
LDGHSVRVTLADAAEIDVETMKAAQHNEEEV